MAMHAGLGRFRHGVWKVRCADAFLQSAVDVDLSLRGGPVVPSVALSGSDLLPGCVEAERMVEFKGPTGAWVNGAPSSSSESERAVMKLPVHSEPVSS